MSGPVTTKEGEPMMEINTTPLIDVMLVLIVMLIITIPIQSHAVKMDMPNANTPPPPPDAPEPEIVKLDVEFDGAVFWNGTPVPDVDTLREFFRQAARRDPQPEIHVRPDRLTKYGYVAIVIANAQKAKLKRIGFAGNEQYLEN